MFYSISSIVWKHHVLIVDFNSANIKNIIARGRMAVVQLLELKFFAKVNERAVGRGIIAHAIPFFQWSFFPRHFHVTFSRLPNKNATGSLLDFEVPVHDELSHKNQKRVIVTRLSHSISLLVFVMPTSTVTDDILFQNLIRKSVFYRLLRYFLDQFPFFKKFLRDALFV